MTTGPQNLAEKLQGSIIFRITKIFYLICLSFIVVLRLSASAIAQQTYIVMDAKISYRRFQNSAGDAILEITS
jgi:hypothetical protein